jgi:hypothetical protein
VDDLHLGEGAGISGDLIGCDANLEMSYGNCSRAPT